MNAVSNMRGRDMLAALLVPLIWGGNFAAVMVAMSHFPPFIMAALRFAVVAALLLPFIRKLPRADMRDTFLLSLTLGTLHFSLIFLAMYQGLGASTSAVIVQLGVPFSCLLGVYFLGDRLGWIRITGLLTAFAGTLVIFGTPIVSGNLDAFVLLIIGCFCWSVANLQIKRLTHVPILTILGWMSVFSAPMLLLISLGLETNHLTLIATATPEAVVGILYSAVFSTIVAYGLWYYLLHRYPVSQVAPFSLLVPVFGTLSGIFILGEVVSPQFWLGSAIIMLGVGIIVIRRPRLARMSKSAC